MLKAAGIITAGIKILQAVSWPNKKEEKLFVRREMHYKS